MIRIAFNELPGERITSYSQYIGGIKETLLEDLTRAFPQAGIRDTDTVWRALTKIYEYCDGERFIFILDEWDFLYHQSFATTEVDVLFQKTVEAAANYPGGLADLV